MKHIRTLAISLLLALTSIDSVHAYLFGLYSSADGSIQFIMLITDDVIHAGARVTASNGATEQSFIIPAEKQTASPITLIATQSFADLKFVIPDFVVRDSFLFPSQGSITVGQINASYTSLPSDDVTALWGGYNDDDGFFQWQDVAVATNAFLRHLTFGPGVPGINALIEFHDSALDDYFLTALPREIEALDFGTVPGWHRTGHSLRAWTSPFVAGQKASTDLRQVCRIYIPPIDGNSHFYSVSQQECADFPVLHPEVVFETDAAFFSTLPGPQNRSLPERPASGIPVVEHS